MGKQLTRTGLSPAEVERRTRLQVHFLKTMLDEQIFDYRDVAKKLAKGDDYKRKLWTTRWRRWMKQEDFKNMVGEIAMAELQGGIPAVVNALVRRASKGNVPAIKLALEASGFWSPRSQVEHTGDIAITLKGLARPASVDDGETITDATVVEE